MEGHNAAAEVVVTGLLQTRLDHQNAKEQRPRDLPAEPVAGLALENRPQPAIQYVQAAHVLLEIP